MIPRMRGRPLAGHLGLALASGILTLGAVEAGLRLAGYRFSPVVLISTEGKGDFRAFHLQADPLVLFDPDLFWRPNPAAWADMDADGVRGRPPRGSGEVLIVAIGDSNTIGAPGSGEHWTADLQGLLDRNAAPRPLRVMNAGCVGWSSLQGLRRFRQVLDLRPAVVFFSFGANEAHRVIHTDQEYAQRVEWLRHVSGLRLAAPVAHRFWGLVDRGRGPGSRPRVSLDEHRRHLEEFVDTARSHSIVPVLLSRPYVGHGADPDHWVSWADGYRALEREVAAAAGAEYVDVYREFAGTPDLFQGESHFNRAGRQRMAALLLHRIKGLGLVATDHVYDRAVEPGRLEDARPELEAGWWAAEQWAGRWGRWTSGEAVARLERRESEDRLEVELELASPRDRTIGRIEVNGRPLASIGGANGTWRRRLDISEVAGPELAVRLVVQDPFVPRDDTEDSPDGRTLGVFVYAIRLLTLHPPGR
jgi:lysophospholipase L1-like esterase